MSAARDLATYCAARRFTPRTAAELYQSRIEEKEDDMSTTVIKALANAFHVLSTSNGMHRERWSAILDDIEENLPSGSGIDCGTKVDRERSTVERIVLSTSFHHMNDCGMYDGWTEHTITATASLLFGLDIKISGRNRNDIKDYLADVYREALEAEYVFPALESWEPKQVNA